jgi:hypothetical protein
MITLVCEKCETPIDNSDICMKCGELTSLKVVYSDCFPRNTIPEELLKIRQLLEELVILKRLNG